MRELATDYYVTQQNSRAEWEVARAELDRRLAEARRLYDPRWQTELVMRKRNRGRIRIDWDRFEFEHKRDIVESQLERIVVRPWVEKSGLEIGRVSVRWWGDDSDQAMKALRNVTDPVIDAWNAHKWMGTAEVCERVGLSEKVVRRMVRAGQLQPVKVFGYLRYRRDEVERLATLLPEMLDLQEVATRLGIRRALAGNWIRAGKLPATKLGRLWYVKAADLEAFSQNGTEHFDCGPANC